MIVLSRIGFDKYIHPYLLQLRVCSFLDPQGIMNRDSTTLNLQEGIITEYLTDEDQIETKISEYVASDDDLKELYSFFTLDAVNDFEKMDDEELSKYETGYFDCANLHYLLLSGDDCAQDGVRHRIYSNDPINRVIVWINKITN